MKETKEWIELILRLYKNKEINSEQALNDMVKAFKASTMFRYESFLLGMFIGGVLGVIIISYQ